MDHVQISSSSPSFCRGSSVVLPIRINRKDWVGGCVFTSIELETWTPEHTYYFSGEISVSEQQNETACSPCQFFLCVIWEVWFSPECRELDMTRYDDVGVCNVSLCSVFSISNYKKLQYAGLTFCSFAGMSPFPRGYQIALVTQSLFTGKMGFICSHSRRS